MTVLEKGLFQLDYRHILTAGLVTHHGLKTAHETLEADPATMSLRLLFIRHLILELANVADLARISASLYKDSPGLNDLYKPIRKEMEFFKYLRNQYVGHFHEGLTHKTFEWHPELNAVAMRGDLEHSWFLSMSALETAINTYVDPDTGHKVFKSDTDLLYPPDNTRFLNSLGETVLGAMTFLTALIDVVRPLAGLPDYKADWLELAMKAGETNFELLRKGKR